MGTYLAFDLGASSGRGILGTLKDGKLSLKEIHRFPNGPLEKDGSFYWDYPALISELKSGLKKALAETESIDGIAIDTWGVDYAFFRGNLDGVLFLGFLHRDGGKATFQRRVLFDIFSVFLDGGRADQLQIPSRQHRL